MATDESYPISAGSLRKIFEEWSVPLPKRGLVLFAFRGCLPVTTGRGWSKSLEVAPADVDYLHMRCTLGIWDTAAGKVFAAPGSTVPHKKNVVKAAAAGGKGANRLEPGFYADLTKGEHLQGKLRGHQALRETASRFYRRAPKGLPYTDASPLYFGNPYDNLHCGWQMDPEEPDYSSAGCMVVAGHPYTPRQPDAEPNQGPWKLFHDLIYAVPQKTFPLLLLPALEAFTPDSKPTRLIFGSRGEAVKALQRKLAARKFYLGKPDGWLGPRTYRAWNRSGFIGP
jgi:hypothetical protein